MARRSAAADAVPARLLVYRAQDWPSAQAWHLARRDYMAKHPPTSLLELNHTWYGPDVVFAPSFDPREVPDAA